MIAITFILFAIANNEDVQQKLYEEIVAHDGEQNYNNPTYMDQKGRTALSTRSIYKTHSRKRYGYHPAILLMAYHIFIRSNRLSIIYNFFIFIANCHIMSNFQQKRSNDIHIL